MAAFFFSLLIICSYFLFSNSRGTLWNKVEKKRMILNGIFIINLQPAFLKARHPPRSSHKFNRSTAIFSNSILLPDAVTPRCHTGWRLQSHNSSFGCDRHSDLAYSIVNIVLSEPPLSDSLTQRAFHFTRPHFHPFPAFFERGPAVWKKKKNDRPALLFRIYCNLCLYTLACVQSVWLEMAVSCPHMCKHVGVFLWRRSKKECVWVCV